MISIPFVYIQLRTVLYYTWTAPQSLFRFSDSFRFPDDSAFPTLSVFGLYSLFSTQDPIPEAGDSQFFSWEEDPGQGLRRITQAPTSDIHPAVTGRHTSSICTTTRQAARLPTAIVTQWRARSRWQRRHSDTTSDTPSSPKRLRPTATDVPISALPLPTLRTPLGPTDICDSVTIRHAATGDPVHRRHKSTRSGSDWGMCY